MTKNCLIGLGCGATCINSQNQCQSDSSANATVVLDKAAELINGQKGNYGSVVVTPQGTLLKTGHSVEKGIGPLEAQVGQLMAAKGFAPKVLRSEGLELEQELLGAPWKAMQRDYEWVEGDSVISPAQTKKLEQALLYLHSNGFSHGDLHGKNLFVNEKTDDIKLIDFGLAKTIAADPRQVYKDVRNAHSRAPGLSSGTSPLAQLASTLQEAKEQLKGKKKRELEDKAVEFYLTAIKGLSQIDPQSPIN